MARGDRDRQPLQFDRLDGRSHQIAGHPLYRFAGDAKAGDTNGQGIIGKWYASSPSGAKT